MRAWLDRHMHRLPWAVFGGGLALDLLTLWLVSPGTPAFEATVRRAGPALFFLCGLLASTLLALLLHWQIRSRRQAEAAALGMTADLALLALVARSTTNAVVVTDLQGRTTWVNTACETLTGYSKAELLGRSPGAMLQCETSDRTTRLRIRQALAAGQPFRGDILNRSKTGRLYWINLDIQLLRDGSGQHVGYIGINSDVTERRQAEQALRVSQAFLHNTGRIAGVGGWELDLDSGLLQWTEQACHILEAAPGHHPSAADCIALVAPEARSQVQLLLAEGLERAGSGWDVQLPVITFGGRRIWVQLVAEGEFGDHGLVRIVGALQDITMRRQLEAETRRSEALLRGAMETIDEAFVLFDPADRLVFCNERYRQMHGISAHLLTPGTPFEAILRHGAEHGLYGPLGTQVDAWVAERLASHRQGNLSGTLQLGDGRVMRLRDRRMPDGHLVGFRFDITDLTRATEAAEQANRAKGEFINTVSHELRTPLQSVIGFSELGKAFAQGQPPFDAMFEDIHAGGQRMLTLVNALLDVSKVDGSPGALSLHRNDLFALAAGVVRELRPLGDKRSVQLRLPEPLPPLPARVDGFRMQQVLRNVLANALRFAPDGSTIELTGVDLGSEGVLLEVRDHGPGIPPDELETIFDAFVQSSRTRDGSGGTGLGLTICRKIMTAHGGIIAATNAPGGGACMRLWLPAAAELSQPASPVAEPPAPGDSIATRSVTPTPAEALP